MKKILAMNVLQAARDRISYAFDHLERIYVSFSGGKDSSVMLHLVMDEAIKRNRKVAVLIIDLEAQYSATIKHLHDMISMYGEHMELHWVAKPMVLRNAVTNFEPRWVAWDEASKDIWVREKPKLASQIAYPFWQDGMEFEEFMVLWGLWYANGVPTGGFVGIRADESLNRFRTVVSQRKNMLHDKRWTTQVIAEDSLYNIYPIYDWKTEDIWRYHAAHPEKPHNEIYDLMHKAGVPLSQQRLCQPFGDDQRRGLWLYHVLEPQTWFKLIARVNGANTGALYVQESGNVMGYGKIRKPDNHTWQSFCNLLLQSLPKPTRDHYIGKFRVFLGWWKKRGYSESGIPDEAPKLLEDLGLAPSYRRLCKVLLRNDWWCKGLSMSQPKSAAYEKYMGMKKRGELEART